jgi:biotin carboxylase
VVSSEKDALSVFENLGTAVVVKPDVGNHGNGSTINVTDPEQLKMAFQAALPTTPMLLSKRMSRETISVFWSSMENLLLRPKENRPMS